MIDAFDAAAGQVKVETEGEKKIRSHTRWLTPIMTYIRQLVGTCERGRGATVTGVPTPASMDARQDRSLWLGAVSGMCSTFVNGGDLTWQGLYSKLVEAFKKMGLEVVPGRGFSTPKCAAMPPLRVCKLMRMPPCMIRFVHVARLRPPHVLGCVVRR